MKRRGLLAGLAAFTLTPGPTAANPSALDPLQGADAIVAWFVKLNRDFETIVAGQERQQLARAIQRLGSDLYLLEIDTVALRDEITAHLPSEVVLRRLDASVAALFNRLRAVKAAVRELGAELRQRDEADTVEERLSIGIGVRGATLNYMEQVLKDARANRAWSREAIVRQLNIGIAAVKDAQTAVMNFHRRLTAA